MARLRSIVIAELASMNSAASVESSSFSSRHLAGAIDRGGIVGRDYMIMQFRFALRCSDCRRRLDDDEPSSSRAAMPSARRRDHAAPAFSRITTGGFMNAQRTRRVTPDVDGGWR